MPIEITKEVYFAPENQQYLFLPGKKDLLAKCVLEEKLTGDNLNNTTFDYKAAQEKLVELQPKNSLAVDSPFMLVFQGQYERTPNELPVADHVALLYDASTFCEKEALRVELDALISKNIGVDVQKDYSLWEAVFRRITIQPTTHFDTSLYKKIELYNDVASFLKNDSSRTPGITKEGYVPRTVVTTIENLTAGKLPKDATFQDKWDYAKKNHPDYVPNDKQMREIADDDFKTNSANFKTMMNSMIILQGRYGLTEAEEPLFNGLVAMSAAQTYALGLAESAGILSGEKLITPDRLQQGIEASEGLSSLLPILDKGLQTFAKDFKL